MPVGGQRIVHAHRSRNTDPEAGCGCGVVSRTVPVVLAITATPAESGSEHSEPPPRSRVPPTDTRLLSSKSLPSPSPRAIDSRHNRCTLPPPATIRAGSAPARARLRTAKAGRAAARGRGGEGRGGSARCGRQAAVSLLSGKPVSARRPSAGRNLCRQPPAKTIPGRSGGRCQVSIHFPAWSGGGRRTRKSLSRFPSWHSPGQRSGRGPRCACLRTAVPDKGREAPRRAAPAALRRGAGRGRPPARRQAPGSVDGAASASSHTGEGTRIGT